MGELKLRAACLIQTTHQPHAGGRGSALPSYAPLFLIKASLPTSAFNNCPRRQTTVSTVAYKQQHRRSLLTSGPPHSHTPAGSLPPPRVRMSSRIPAPTRAFDHKNDTSSSPASNPPRAPRPSSAYFAPAAKENTPLGQTSQDDKMSTLSGSASFRNSPAAGDSTDTRKRQNKRDEVS